MEVVPAIPLLPIDVCGGVQYIEDGFLALYDVVLYLIRQPKTFSTNHPSYSVYSEYKIISYEASLLV